MHERETEGSRKCQPEGEQQWVSVSSFCIETALVAVAAVVGVVVVVAAVVVVVGVVGSTSLRVVSTSQRYET
jgi:hypothetical protein